MIRIMEVLYCVECGCCSGELGKGWVAMRCDDPSTDIAESYVCAWDPLPAEAADE